MIQIGTIHDTYCCIFVLRYIVTPLIFSGLGLSPQQL